MHFDKRWLMEPATSFLETPAITILLRGLKSNVDLSNLESYEKTAFLEVTMIFNLFCENVVLSARTYNENDVEGLSGVTIKHLGMG